jgi:hypothetical protein
MCIGTSWRKTHPWLMKSHLPSLNRNYSELILRFLIRKKSTSPYDAVLLLGPIWRINVLSKYMNMLS